MIVVERNNPHDPQATALLQQSHALMRSLFPPEDNFYLDVDQLAAPHVHFFTAREGNMLVGTAALKTATGYGEVKSMFVLDTARGKGVGDALLRQIIDDARAQKLTVIKLETGNLLHAAHRLYARHGFVPCGVFGNYHAAASSLFMEKQL
jgi:putative acetyltransferase